MGPQSDCSPSLSLHPQELLSKCLLLRIEFWGLEPQVRRRENEKVRIRVGAQHQEGKNVDSSDTHL